MIRRLTPLFDSRPSATLPSVATMTGEDAASGVRPDAGGSAEREGERDTAAAGVHPEDPSESLDDAGEAVAGADLLADAPGGAPSEDGAPLP